MGCVTGKQTEEANKLQGKTLAAQDDVNINAEKHVKEAGMGPDKDQSYKSRQFHNGSPCRQVTGPTNPIHRTGQAISKPDTNEGSYQPQVVYQVAQRSIHTSDIIRVPQ